LSGSLSYQNKRWATSLIAHYQSAKRDPNEQNVPANITTTEYTDFAGYRVYNAHISYMVQAQMELYLHIDNLLDEQYLLPASRPANSVGVPGSGRVVSAGLRWSFN
jgi:outer membrane receptor protein involved in Fe transport